MTLTRDRELWGCALQVLRQPGERAPEFIAERVSALASAGDELGVSTWLAITLAVVWSGKANLSCWQLRRGRAVYHPEWDNGRRIHRACPDAAR